MEAEAESSSHPDPAVTSACKDAAECSDAKALPYLGTFLYTYNAGALVYEVRFESDVRLHWKGVVGEDLGQEEYEDNYRAVIAPNVHFLNWQESSGMVVTQVLNFEAGTVHTCMVLNGIPILVKGTIKRVEETELQ